MAVALGILLIVLGVPLALTGALYASARGRGTAGLEPLRGAAAVVAFLAEVLAGLASLLTLPFRLRPAVAAAPARGVVLLVPEIGCSSATFRPLARRLRAAGWTVLAAAEHPRARDLAPIAEGLEARIAHVPTGIDVVVLAHGGGGVAAHLLAARGATGIRRVITLGAPHQGSRAAGYRVLGLPATAPAARDGVDVVAIYSDFDAWLVPMDGAYCPGAFNIAVRGIGHFAMLWSRRVAELVLENLDSPPTRR